MALLALSGCGDPQAPGGSRPVLAAAIVSDPTPRAPSAAGTVGVAVSATAADEVAYVSLRPGSITVLTSDSATFRNRRTGDDVSVMMREGGFDPVAVPARAGDVLDLDVATEYDTPLTYSVVVPRKKHPEVVRTNPPTGKRDLPGATRLSIVFSEPMDPTTLTASAIMLLRGSVPVAGGLRFEDAPHLTVTFVPDANLALETRYDLAITEASRDLDGDSLEYGPVTAWFSTLPGGRIAFVKNGSGIWVMRPDGSGARQLTTFGTHPAWSPDGARIAFWGGTGIWVTNADGSGLRQITTFGTPLYGPSWSPDGARLAFTYGLGIYVMNADGSDTTRIAAKGVAPAWSPDGSTIAFLSPTPAGNGVSWVAVVNPDGTGARTLSDWSSAIGPPAWSPDGSRLAFRAGAVLYVMTADGSGPGAPAEGFPSGDGGVAWSPDGTYWALSSSRDQPLTNPPRARPQLFVISVDGSSITRVTDEAAVFSWPAWTR